MPGAWGASTHARVCATLLARYLNLVHFLCYKSKTGAMQRCATDIDLVTLGLITPNEAKDLIPMGNKMRDTVLSWIGVEISAPFTFPPHF